MSKAASWAHLAGMLAVAAHWLPIVRGGACLLMRTVGYGCVETSVLPCPDAVKGILEELVVCFMSKLRAPG